MSGREIFERITEKNFALQAEEFAERKELLFESHEEAIEFLVLYGCLLTSKDQPYNAEQLLLNYSKFNASLKEKEFFTFLDKKYRVLEEKTTCSAT